MSFLCSFCSHANPAGSKFCNECGSPLGFKPCPGCEAVNARDAQSCHQCGGDLAPRPAPAPDAFEERLDTLRRYVDSLEGTPAAQRLGLLTIGARREQGALPDPTPAPKDAALEPTMRHEPTLPTPASTDMLELSRGPVILGATPEPRTPTLAWTGAPEPQPPEREEVSAPSAFPSDAALPEPAPAESSAAPMGEPPPTSPANELSAPSRRPSPGFFYAAGLGLIVLGLLGYAYSLYGLPVQAEQWIGSVRALARISIASVMSEPMPQTTPQAASGPPTPDTPEPVKAVVDNSPPATVPGAAPVPSAPSPPASTNSATPATTGPESTVATAQPAPTTTTEAPAPAAQPPSAAVALPTEGKPEPVASEGPAAKATKTRAAKKRGSHTASKRADPRKPPSHRSMIDPEEQMPAGADTRATAYPGVYNCTSGVAALGLCDPDQRQGAN